MSTTKKIDLKTITKILVIQLKPFGDVLLTTAYFETLKKKLPQAKLYYLESVRKLNICSYWLQYIAVRDRNYPIYG